MNKIARLCLLALVFGIIAHSCIAAEDDQRPPEHLCPITQEVMRDPVVAADGHSYEKEAITQWYQIRGCISPITRQQLENNLFPNQALKTMIQEWKPGRHDQPSALEGRSVANIAERIKAEFEKNGGLLNAAKDRHIVAFLGNTGSGKSTLVNFLANKELRVSNGGRDYVLANPGDSEAMVIGTGGDSKTLYPQCIDIGDLRLFDLPGFNDTDGSERNLVNAAFARQILLEAASVRLVFVVGEDQFTADRSSSVRQMFYSIRQLFVTSDPTENIVDYGAFVVTKATCDDQAGDMVEFLLDKTNSQDKVALNEQLRSWAGQGRLRGVPHPLLAGLRRGDKADFSDIMQNTLRLIQDIRPVKVSGVNVSVLYPPETVKHLGGVFYDHMEGSLKHHLSQPSLPADVDVRQQYERSFALLQAISRALEERKSDDFWSGFDRDVSSDPNVGLLRNFCLVPYGLALNRFTDDHKEVLRKHVEALRGEERRIWGAVESLYDGHMKGELAERLTEPTTLSAIKGVSASLTRPDFWVTFGREASLDEGVAFWKGKNESLYQEALKCFHKDNQERINQHVKTLSEKAQRRVTEMEGMTKNKAKEVVRLVLQKHQVEEDALDFDFVFHREIYDHVCTEPHISLLTSDEEEQNIVHRACALFMSQYTHEQMKRGYDRSSAELMRRLESIEQRLLSVAPIPSANATVPVAVAVIERPLQAIMPDIARGYEEVYQRFVNGKLIYKPDPNSDTGRIEFPFRVLANPLEGTFDLSRCGDSGQHLSISTGYRKGKKAENANKVEIWLAPRFLIERNLATTAAHLQPIMGDWNAAAAPVGVFWTWGAWVDMGNFDYLTTDSFEDLSSENLFEKYTRAHGG